MRVDHLLYDCNREMKIPSNLGGENRLNKLSSISVCKVYKETIECLLSLGSIMGVGERAKAGLELGVDGHIRKKVTEMMGTHLE